MKGRSVRRETRGELTGMLDAWGAGDQAAFQSVFERMYPRLLQVAAHILKKADNHDLNPEELVHEAYMDLLRAVSVKWRNRQHFLAVASRSIKECFADYIHQKMRQKRGGDFTQVSMDKVAPKTGPKTDMWALSQVIKQLRRKNHRQYLVVHCRYFQGLTVSETARVMGLSPRSVQLEWSRARTWLFLRLYGTC